MMNYLINDFRVILKNELQKRILKNPKYSLRAFARDLKIPPSTLSDVLNSVIGVSSKRALQICESLGLTQNEADFFQKLVSLENAKSEDKKREIKEELEKFESEDYQVLQDDIFHSISDWYHFALMELTFVDDFKNDSIWISKKLGITELQVSEAVDRLIRLKLLEKRGNKLIKTQKFLSSTDQIPSEAIRLQHKELLNKAIIAVDNQTVAERDFAAITMSFDSSRIDEAKVFLKQMRRKFNKKFAVNENNNSVYELTVNLFRLDKNI